MTERPLLRRYWTLCALFGLVFGVRYTLDIWLIERLAGPDGAWNYKFAYVLVSLFFMLVGEVAGGIVSDYRSRTGAVVAAVPAVWLWAATAWLAIGRADPNFLLVAAGGFGLAFGFFHATLEAWVDDALKRVRGAAGDGRQVTAYQVYWGAVANYLGILVSSAAAFPLVFHGQFGVDVKTGAGAGGLPYAVAAGVAGLVLIFPPQTVPGSGHAPGGGLRAVVHGYRAVLAGGSFFLWAALFVGGTISLLIQYIDHFAPADMLGGGTVSTRTESVVIYNAIICAGTVLLGLLLNSLRPPERLGRHRRAAVIALALACVLALLVVMYWRADEDEPVLKPVLISLAQTFLLAVPPLVKVWTLDHAVEGLRSTVQSLLGVSKRLFGIGSTLVVWLTIAPEGSEDAGERTLYALMIGVVAAGLAVLAVVALRRK